MVVNGSKGYRTYGSKGTVPRSNLYCGGAVGAIVRQQEMGGDQGDAQGPGGVPPPGGATDHGDDVEMRGRRRVVLSLGIGGNGDRGDQPNQGVYPETAGNHNGKGGLSPYL